MSEQPPHTTERRVDKDGVTRIATTGGRARTLVARDARGPSAGSGWAWVLAGLFACACLGIAVWVVLASRVPPAEMKATRTERRVGDEPRGEEERERRMGATAPRAEERGAPAVVDEGLPYARSARPGRGDRQDAPDEDPVPPELLVHPGEVPVVTEGKSGLSAFPPRGTKPIKRGIVVPENYPLPPGYMRHYQSSDDGEQLPAILMFHPDHKPVDKAGRPVALPEDRVVPPELAPPGMPIQVLDVPEGAPK